MKVPQFSIGDRVTFMRIAFDSNGHIGNITERYRSRNTYLYNVMDDAGTVWLAVPETALIRIVEA